MHDVRHGVIMQQTATPFLLDEESLAQVAEETRVWQLAHGLVMGVADDDSKATHAPVILLPSPMSRQVYFQACQLATDFNVLVDRASRDHEFICSSLER